MGSDGAGEDDQLTVVPAEVGDAGQFVKLTAEAMVAGVRSVDREIHHLMESWTGDGAEAYLAGWQETRDGALEVLRALETMAHLLGVSSGVYTTAETVNTTSYLDMGM
ncbi:WXG100 family type VII secretion target [Nocardia wallacei]|uniref:WXG100 family type VII secretion target n=1 Tax=Nocardia wallacei TaxID=480035 RepID=UPI002455ACBA|nr:WXG100 family type VII secretion target [Nocardia wallacei]